jgi:predicted O-methyltransferase YrrM
MALVIEKTIEEILSYREQFLQNAHRLHEQDPSDNYWRDLSDPAILSRNGVFLESNMMVMWMAQQHKPKRILEIGTRTGGSLIALLCNYSEKDRESIVEILSFDMWREYFSTTPAAKLLAKLLRRKNNLNISEKYLRFLGSYIQKSATGKVVRNLKLFGIKADKITFISGDSKITVPLYFQKYPDKKFDYILVDGGHDEITAYQDLKNVVNYCDKGGYIVFDDICPESYNLIGVWEKFKKEHESEFDFFEIMHRKGIGWAVKR